MYHRILRLFYVFFFNSNFFKRSQSDALQEEAFFVIFSESPLRPYLSTFEPQLSPVGPKWDHWPSRSQMSPVEPRWVQLSPVEYSWDQLSPVKYCWAKVGVSWTLLITAESKRAWVQLRNSQWKSDKLTEHLKKSKNMKPKKTGRAL